MMITGRAIGPVGTIARIIPAVVLLGQWVRLRFTRAPLRATGPVGHLLNILLIAALLVPSATRPATLVWLGFSMMIAAWRGYAGCSRLAISNWLLRRDDQVGCVVFWPLDAVEARVEA